MQDIVQSRIFIAISVNYMYSSTVRKALVEAAGLTKIYPPRGSSGAFCAVDGLDFEVGEGESFGLLGPNGAGKSSTMRVIRERSAELLAFAQLEDKHGDQVDTLSGGMRRRLAIARSLINEPEILLLDEPTTGLDPQARHLLWDRLFRLKKRGVCLIITTHYMDEAEQLCDRLVVIDHGRIVAHGSPRE